MRPPIVLASVVSNLFGGTVYGGLFAVADDCDGDGDGDTAESLGCSSAKDAVFMVQSMLSSFVKPPADPPPKRAYEDACRYKMSDHTHNIYVHDVDQVLHTQDVVAPLPVYERMTGMFDLSTGLPLGVAREGGDARDVTVAVASDWGSGTCEARAVAELMAAEQPNLTLHLGDVYPSGKPEDYLWNVLGQKPEWATWEGVRFPQGSMGTFLLAGNHDMMSGGQGLYTHGFEYTGQKATFAAYQSDHWRLLFLDTGYNAYEKTPDNYMRVSDGAFRATDSPQPPEIMEWLKNTVRLGDPEDTRGLVIFTHHMPFGVFERSYTATALQLNKLLPPGKTVLWFTGHEHRLALHKELQINGTNFSMHLRVQGNGGIPWELWSLQENLAKYLKAFDARVYRRLPKKAFFAGYSKLRFNGPSLEVAYFTAQCAQEGCEEAGLSGDKTDRLALERFEVDSSSGALRQEWLDIDYGKLSEPPESV